MIRLLVCCNCNVAAAARKADINRTDLHRQLKRLRIDLKQLAADMLAKANDEALKEKVRRRLERKAIKPDWDKPIPGYQPYKPKQKNNNVRT